MCPGGGHLFLNRTARRDSPDMTAQRGTEARRLPDRECSVGHFVYLAEVLFGYMNFFLNFIISIFFTILKY